MANFDQFQVSIRPSARIRAKQIKAEEEAQKAQSKSQVDDEDVSKPSRRTPTPQSPRQRSNKPKQTSRRTSTKPISTHRTPREETTDDPATVSRPATRGNAKRKLEAEKNGVGDNVIVAKRTRVSDAPSTTEALPRNNDTLEAQAHPVDGKEGEHTSQTSSPLSTPLSSPVLAAMASQVSSRDIEMEDASDTAFGIASTLNPAPIDETTNTVVYASVLDGAVHEAASQSNSGPVAERENESSLPTPPSNEPQTPSAHNSEDKSSVEDPGADNTGEIQTDRCLLATPMPVTNNISQLLTPPATSRSSDSEEGTSSGVQRPKRNRIQREIFGDVVSTVSAIDAVVEEAGLQLSSQNGIDDLDASEIEVAMRSPLETPKPLRSRRKNSSASGKTTPSSRKTKAAASKEPAQVKRKVFKSATKITPESQEIVIEASNTTAASGSAVSGTRRKSSSASPGPGIAGNSPSVESKTAASRRKSLIVTLPFPQPDAQQLALSQALTRREPLASKPEPQGQPEVWADSRQALCETLPYFKKPQGGCYQNDGHVYGFLFDSVGHCREYMDEDVIICRAGGSMESDGGGGMVQRKDQTLQEAQVQAVLNDIAHHNPVIVICGNRNVKSPSKMPHVYCVLGWYKPIAVWSEKTAGKGTKVWTTVKYRLERLNCHRPAWHAPKMPSSEDERPIPGVLTNKTCDHCHQEYPQVYLRSWICLNQRCDRFWTINGANAPLGSEGMEYNPAFLLHRSKPWANENEQDEPEPSSLRPSLPNFGNTIGDNLTYVNTRGICCPQCGRCSSRRLFSGWVCENPVCDFQLPVAHQPIPPAMLYTPWDAAPTLVRNRHAPNVQIAMEHKHGYKVSVYTFEGIDGRFIHAAATKAVVQEERGADDMFRIMQSEDIGLERRTFAGKKMSGGRGEKGGEIAVEESLAIADSNALEVQAEHAPPETMDVEEVASSEKKPEFADGDLMTAFSMNYGMPYKFVASGASKPFESAPEAVTEARRRLNWASRVFLQTSKQEDFNELLIFAYLQGQKVEYHDDGEEGLGPHIAALSLGGRAKMHMRMKMKHHVGCSKTGLFTEERPVPGGMAYEERLQMWNELQPLKANDSAAYAKRRKEIPKEIGIFEKRNKKADDLVTVSLSHGDIVLMDGYDIQKYLEHKVVPEDHLRFALTCRTVLENHLKPEERPEYVVERDERLYNGPNL